MKQVVYKQFETKATSIDEANYQITFKVSDSRIDRQGEIVSQKDWQIDNYMSNPVMLFGHDPSKPEYVIGRCISLTYDAAADCHYGTFELDADINATAALIWRQLVKGTLRTVSIGFIPHTQEYEDDVPVLSAVEPVEVSVVPIPANAGALAKQYKAGELTEKDASYIMKAMRDEADRIEQQLKVTRPVSKEKSMTPEQTQAIIDGMAKLTEKVDTLTAESEAAKTAAAEAQRIADEAANAPVVMECPSCKVEQPAENAFCSACGKSMEAEGDDDLAKSGDNDQDGAKEGELDEDTELTPEQEAEAREALGLPVDA